MALEDDIRFFSQNPTLGILGDQALRILAIGAEMRFLPKDSVLFHAGELADCGYIVQDGSLELEAVATSGHERVIAGPGTLLGETALLVDTSRAATATAREPSTVLRISRSLFLKMLEGYPDAARRLRDGFAARNDQWASELANVKKRLSVDSRAR